MYVCMYVCMCVCMYVCVCIYKCMHARMLWQQCESVRGETAGEPLAADVLVVPVHVMRWYLLLIFPSVYEVCFLEGIVTQCSNSQN